MHSFLRRLLGAAKLRAAVYEEVEADERAFTQALISCRFIQRRHEYRSGRPDRYRWIADGSRHGLHRLGIVVRSDLLHRGPVAPNAYRRKRTGANCFVPQALRCPRD